MKTIVTLAGMAPAPAPPTTTAATTTTTTATTITTTTTTMLALEPNQFTEIQQMYLIV